MYDRTINNINRQQTSWLPDGHTQLACVIRAATPLPVLEQANRLERIASDQRGLDAQKATIEYARSRSG